MKFLNYYFKRVYDVLILPFKVRRKCKYFLKSGKYIIEKNYTVLRMVDSKDDNMIITFSDPPKNNNKTINGLFRKILSNRYINIDNKNQNVFDGSSVIISSSNRQYKIFDYKNKKILTKYNDYKQYSKCISNYNYLKTIYNIPCILKNNKKELYTIESMITPTKNDIGETLDYIINNTIKNFDKYRRKDSIKKNNVKYIDDIICLSIKNIYDTVSNNSIYIKCHGDIWDGNVLFNNKDFYIIDVEASNYYLFFYDIFFYIFSQIYYLNNDQLLLNYLNGEYDERFKELFLLFNSKYDNKLRKEYFISFIYEYMYDRKIGINNYTSKKEFLKIKNFIFKYGLLGEKDE